MPGLRMLDVTEAKEWLTENMKTVMFEMILSSESLKDVRMRFIPMNSITTQTFQQVVRKLTFFDIGITFYRSRDRGET